MEFVDQAMLQRTVRFTFVEGAPPDTRNWIIKSVKKCATVESIEAVFKLADGKWYVTLDHEDSVVQVTSAAWDSLTPKVTVQRCDRRMVNLRVNWLPVWIDISTVEQYLSQYGIVKQCQRETETFEGVTFKNGSIKVVLDIPEKDFAKLPHKTVIASCSVLLTVAGRPPFCLKCKEVGHIRKDCPKNKQSSASKSEDSIPSSASQQSSATQQSDSWAESPMEDTGFDVESCFKDTEETQPVKKSKLASTQESEPVKKSKPSGPRVEFTHYKDSNELFVKTFDDSGECKGKMKVPPDFTNELLKLPKSKRAEFARSKVRSYKSISDISFIYV